MRRILSCRRFSGLWRLSAFIVFVAAISFEARADIMAVDAPVLVGASISFSPEWLSHAQKDQREFIVALRGQKRPVKIETIPRNRLHELMDEAKLDCILSSTTRPMKDTFKAQRSIVFKVELFKSKHVDLDRLPAIRIGLLANLAKPEVPFSGKVDWYPLRSISQGVQLLASRRLDVIVADQTRVAMTGTNMVVSAGLPVLRYSEIALICRDIPPLRDFVQAFDRSFELSKPGM